MKVTIEQVAKGITDSLQGIYNFKQIQANLDLTESIPETPLVQVYFEDYEASKNSANDRISFRTKGMPIIRQVGMKFHVDVYAKARANIGEDMLKLVNLADEVIDVLEQQENTPFFGVEGIKSFSYTASRVVFTYGRTKYAGIRFILDLTII